MLAGNAQGALNMFTGGPSSQAAMEKALLGVVGINSGGGGRWARAGGQAVKGAISPAEASLVSRLLARPATLTPRTALSPGEIQMLGQAIGRALASHNPGIYLDGKKMAEVLRQNPGASRELAEAVAMHSKKQHARR